MKTDKDKNNSRISTFESKTGRPAGKKRWESPSLQTLPIGQTEQLPPPEAPKQS